jgi:hypothetical protein
MGGDDSEWLECIDRNRGEEDSERGRSFGQTEEAPKRTWDIRGWESKPENRPDPKKALCTSDEFVRSRKAGVRLNTEMIVLNLFQHLRTIP